MKKNKKKLTIIPFRDKMEKISSWLDDKQGEDIVLLDVSKICSVAEGIVVVTARTARHAQALADHVLDMTKAENHEFFGSEGYRDAEWILLDLNDVLVHVFRAEHREFYDMEGLWSEAKKM
ncbi:MAG: ribosome silencing factor [Desulfovibrio sp.]